MRRDPVERRPAARARRLAGVGGVPRCARSLSLSLSLRSLDSTLCHSLRERDHTRAETREEKAVLLTRLHVLEQPFS